MPELRPCVLSIFSSVIRVTKYRMMIVHTIVSTMWLFFKLGGRMCIKSTAVCSTGYFSVTAVVAR